MIYLGYFIMDTPSLTNEYSHISLTVLIKSRRANHACARDLMSAWFPIRIKM